MREKEENAYFAVLLEVEEELAAVDVVEDEVELIFSLKGEVQVDDKGVLDLLKDLVAITMRKEDEERHFRGRDTDFSSLV